MDKYELVEMVGVAVPKPIYYPIIRDQLKRPMFLTYGAEETHILAFFDSHEALEFGRKVAAEIGLNLPESVGPQLMVDQMPTVASQRGVNNVFVVVFHSMDEAMNYWKESKNIDGEFACGFWPV